MSSTRLRAQAVNATLGLAPLPHCAAMVLPSPGPPRAYTSCCSIHDVRRAEPAGPVRQPEGHQASGNSNSPAWARMIELSHPPDQRPDRCCSHQAATTTTCPTSAKDAPTRA